ncbi:MAG: ribonucleotide reductase N-terminal alpha domain-containing protein, partial [Candidatus Parcubacteria bacterium]|nr:ribonucleotide reductase N-terminal alpha domain-containing protein [Candidatus Parcubacteria bacterium]
MVKTKIKYIQKRDGETIPFDQERITSAILKAGQAMAEFNGEKPKVISDMVVEMLNKFYGGRRTPLNVEDIQDMVEIAIMKAGFTKSAKAYILYRQEHQRIREQKKKILSGRVTKLPLSVNALKVIANRYLLRNEKTDEVLETPEDMFRRVAKAMAKIEKKYGAKQKKISDLEQKFYEMMVNFEFLPGGRTLANAGTSTPVVSNCIVLHIEDSMEGIFQTLKDASLLQQAGSGLGFPFHMLRPAGTIAKKTRGVASGPVSFLKVYNQAFGVIKQQGRHGANMGVMRVDHPDILDFIHCKQNEGEINNFNISIAVTDEFMRQVESKSKEPWVCTFNGKKMF